MKYLIIAIYDSMYCSSVKDYTGDRPDIDKQVDYLYRTMCDYDKTLEDMVVEKYKNDYDLIVICDNSDIFIWKKGEKNL